MTEAVFLALIALFGMLIFATVSTIHVKLVLKYAPTHFKIWTGYGHIEINFDNEADE